MNHKEIIELAKLNQAKAREVLADSNIIEIWESAGCRVSLVGSLRMGLLASHRDIDLHVYSQGITTISSFAIMAKIAANPAVTEIKCINGLHTDEHCIAWHVYFKATDGEIWQIDIIHIEAGSSFDGYFEHMADRISEVMTPTQKGTILKLKFETPADLNFHGVEYYEAVIADGITDFNSLRTWVEAHRQQPPYYWIP